MLCLTLSGWLISCGQSESSSTGQGAVVEDDPSQVKVYYVNNEETGILSEDYTLESDPSDSDAVIAELLEQLETIPSKLEYEAPLTGSIQLQYYRLQNEILSLSFDATYHQISKTTEILDRAAMVRTLSQVQGVKYVSFLIDGRALEDDNGVPIGNMTADTFIYNAGNEINAYEKVQLTLYFANETGDELIPVYRTVVYNSNISMERLAMEQLIKGPNTTSAYPTINSETGIVGVTLRDGICYVNLDENFLSEPYSVTPEVAIYSIVNTLVEFSDVNKVQISVNGETSEKFMDAVNLTGSFERNLDIIRKN